MSARNRVYPGTTKESYYAILGVDCKVSVYELKQKYKQLARNYHPDKGGDGSIMQLINEAYETLSNPDLRGFYDKQSFNGHSDFFQETHFGRQDTHAENQSSHSSSDESTKDQKENQHQSTASSSNSNNKEENFGRIVFTAGVGGACYHQEASCTGLRNAKAVFETNLEHALLNAKRPCKFCLRKEASSSHDSKTNFPNKPKPSSNSSTSSRPASSHEGGSDTGESGQSVACYVSRTGKCYHSRATCRGISLIPMESIPVSLRPCKICHVS